MKLQNYGFEPGKGSAYDYLPDWMEIPALYSTENTANPTAVVKLFALGTHWSWYIFESDGELCFGLVEGLEIELGYFSLSELRPLKLRYMDLPRVERDLWFKPTPVRDLAAYKEAFGEEGPYKGEG